MAINLNPKQRFEAWKYCLVFLATVALLYVYACFDAARNSWLEQAVSDWRWYNMFTSRHGITVLYLQHSPWFWVMIMLSSVIATAIFWWRKH